MLNSVFVMKTENLLVLGSVPGTPSSLSFCEFECRICSIGFGRNPDFRDLDLLDQAGFVIPKML